MCGDFRRGIGSTSPSPPSIPILSITPDRLVGLVIMASTSRAEDPGFESRLSRIFLRSSHTNDSPVAIPCQAPGVIASALGLVGPVSVYCNWVRWKIVSAASISVWQQVQLSEQIRPWIHSHVAGTLSNQQTC